MSTHLKTRVITVPISLLDMDRFVSVMKGKMLVDLSISLAHINLLPATEMDDTVTVELNRTESGAEYFFTVFNHKRTMNVV